MPRPTADLTNRVIGRLTVLCQTRKYGRVYWACQCSCGSTKVIAAISLTGGATKSCGCLQRERAATAQHRHGGARRHGAHYPEYRVFRNAISRCENPHNKHFQDYGGRGILICAEWRRDFAAFLRDMGPRPSSLHTLDRLDNDGPYAPENCRWATIATQANNRRDTRRLTWNGQTHSMSDWARLIGLRPDTLKGRLKNGWTLDRALTAPVRAW